MAYTETLFIYKDTYLLCKLLLKYSKNVSRIIRYGAYETMTSKACTALDLVRRINESFEGREENLHEFILLMSEVKSRINLFTDADFLPVKTATNLNYQVDKVLKEAYGWQKAERNRRGESRGA